MKDRQVEIVAGPHLVARVAGAVLLVAHRGPGRPTTGAPAVRALESLAGLVHEAAAAEPDGPGALVARNATRWLMVSAERISPGVPVDFGILSPAPDDQVAIFLHGSVTAVLADERMEYLRGRDAVFTLDRVIPEPSRAVALYADDTPPDAEDHPARDPVLPARGIGWLAEGIAEATGAILWSPGAAAGSPTGRAEVAPQDAEIHRSGTDREVPVSRGVPLRRDVPVGGEAPVSGGAPAHQDAPVSGEAPARRDVSVAGEAPVGGAVPVGGEESFPSDTEDTEITPPVPTARIDREPPASAAELTLDSGDSVPGASPMLDSAEISRRGQRLPHDETEVSGPRRLRARPDTGTAESMDSPGGHRDSHGSGFDHVTPAAARPTQPDTGPPHRATPPLDPELRRRTEATAKGIALTVKVLGFKCARAHPTDPRSAFCTVCGMPVDQTQPLIEVMRPPLGILVLDDGATHMLAADTVLGRDPENSEQARRGLVPVQVVDNSGGMSRAHAELLLVNWDVTLVDRGSTNGTRIRAAGYRDWVRIAPHQPVILLPGTEVLLGNRVLRLEPVAPPPFT